MCVMIDLETDRGDTCGLCIMERRLMNSWGRHHKVLFTWKKTTYELKNSTNLTRQNCKWTDISNVPILLICSEQTQRLVVHTCNILLAILSLLLRTCFYSVHLLDCQPLSIAHNGGKSKPPS